MVTLVVADDNPAMRERIRAMLEHESTFRVLGVAANGSEALEMVVRLQPDFLVTDFMMPGINGLQLAERLVTEAPKTRVLVVSATPDSTLASEAWSRVAAGFLPKSLLLTNLITAIHEILRGRRYPPAPVVPAL